MKIVTIDYETHAIGERPSAYPPEPVGVSIKINDEPSTYLSWGHPSGNNCTKAQAKVQLEEALYGADKILSHNTMFEGAITIEKMGIPFDWAVAVDTMVMAFIDNPHGELKLKPLAEQKLGLPPEEQDDVRDYIYAHGLCKRNSKQWGAFISMVPARIVAPYAEGDTDRTYDLWNYYNGALADSQKEALATEMRLMPHIYKMEVRGVNIDGERLAEDLAFYEAKMLELDAKIHSILGCEVDVDSNEDLADAIEAAGKSSGFAKTPTGKRSTAKDSLIGAIADNELLGSLLLRGSIATCIRTFMKPWLEQYKDHGRLFIRWNQVRNYSDTGARTGRLSSSPNLQNVPTEWEGLRAKFEKIGFTLPFELPAMRSYIIPDEGKIFISRDYSGQEMRLLAHFAGGKLLEILRENPEADVHMIAAEIAHITRKVAKTLGFGILYGAGKDTIAEQLAVDVALAMEYKAQYLSALPEIKQLQNSVSQRGRLNQPVRTLGGRLYYAEQPKSVGGMLKSFEYKLINYLIQGSAADQTKMAMIRYGENTEHGELCLSVHDELVAQCDIPHEADEAVTLEWAMNGSYLDTLDYEVVSTGASGYNFGAL